MWSLFDYVFHLNIYEMVYNQQMQALISWANVSIYFYLFFFHSVFEKDIEKFKYKSEQEGEQTQIWVKTAGP